MIDKIIENIINNNITFEEYSLLKLSDKYNINEFKDRINCLDTKILLLQSKGWLNVGECPEITKKAREIISKIENGNIKKKSSPYEKLHSNLQEHLLKLTGKKQKMIQNKYAFLPNNTDLIDRITKIAKKYKLTDVNRIENVLKNHISKAVKANFEYIPTIQYYILKDGNSQMVNDYEGYDEKDVKTDKKLEEPKDIKNLF